MLLPMDLKQPALNDGLKEKDTTLSETSHSTQLLDDIKEAFEDIKEGRTKSFNSVNELLKNLDD